MVYLPVGSEVGSDQLAEFGLPAGMLASNTVHELSADPSSAAKEPRLWFHRATASRSTPEPPALSVIVPVRVGDGLIEELATAGFVKVAVGATLSRAATEKPRAILLAEE